MNRDFGLYGIDQLLQSNSCGRKVFWGTLTVGAACALAICLNLMYHGFTASPYMVTVTRHEVTNYPTMAYVPSHAPYEDALERMGLTLGDYVYMQMHMAYSFALMRHQLGDKTMSCLIDSSAAKKRVYDAMEDNNSTKSLLRLLVDTTLPPADVIECYGLCNLEIHIGLVGVLYTIAPRKELNGFLAGYAVEGMLISVKHQVETPEVRNYYSGVRGRLAIGDRADSFIPSPSFYVPTEPGHLLVYLTINAFTRVSNCQGGTIAAQDACILDCYRDICKRLGLCDPMSPDLNLACNWIDQSDKKLCDLTKGERAKLTRVCRTKCLMPCKEVSYGVTIQQMNMGEVNETRITIRYANMFTAQNFQEKYMFTWDLLVSNIGGQVSLWLGASILAVPQMILWIFDHLHQTAKHREKKIPKIGMRPKKGRGKQAGNVNGYSGCPHERRKSL